MLTLAGRTDVERYFSLSGIRSYTKLRHTPFLVFLEHESGTSVQTVYSAKKLLEYPDETKVMGQWRGEYDSHFFQFTVGQFREFLTAHPKRDGQRV